MKETIELYCHKCDKRLPHRECQCLECGTAFDVHRRRSRIKMPEPGRAVRSYDGGMVPENWGEFVKLYNKRIERGIDCVIVGTSSCSCKRRGSMDCVSCEAVEDAFDEIACCAMMISHRQSFRLQWECHRDAMSLLFERMHETGLLVV